MLLPSLVSARGSAGPSGGARGTWLQIPLGGWQAYPIGDLMRLDVEKLDRFTARQREGLPFRHRELTHVRRKDNVRFGVRRHGEGRRVAEPVMIALAGVALPEIWAAELAEAMPGILVNTLALE